MERYIKELNNGRKISYGSNDSLGYFFDVFGSEGNLLISEDSKNTHLSDGKMIELMDLFELPESHIEMVAMKLPIK